MNDPRIILESVHLHYVALAFQERSVMSWLAGLARSGRRSNPVGDIHALKGVCLEINKAERVGLLGHNGAGKSTLLKAIAGLYPISGGTLDVRGDTRALFNIGLGFEPDATGRENILYRGLLLGESPASMRIREQEIIEFAGLGKFIDYPLKTYSAGMQVRLSFAISTAIAGSILLVDEVIGAGDAEFMVRAKHRIAELIDKSEILVLASHDLQSIEAFCERAIVLHEGRLVYDGPVGHAINEYRRTNAHE